MTTPDLPTLPEYEGNLWISRLPPIKSQLEIYQELRDAPYFNEKEPGYPRHYRKHCIARLANCFLPQARQVILAERFSMLLRQGYVGRNPLTHDYLKHIYAGIERIERRSLDAAPKTPVKVTASSFGLLGCPGVGKTVSVRRVLAQYPQTIQHDNPFSITQIVWLRLEAPVLGSLRQLCIDFFHAVDELIGTDYVKRYGKSKTTEQLTPYMAQVANLHGLGVLVIDEIQHLRGAKVGANTLMNFLVKLVNTIGVPVIPIGTFGALPTLQGNFSTARRSTGLGSQFWDRIVPGPEWDRFLSDLWKYQWTTPPTALNGELNAVMYDQSQGVVDLAVKLFMLAQMRVVDANQSRKRQSEELTPRLIRTVARDEFQLVAPMIKALRENDNFELNMYDDLRGLDAHIQSILGGASDPRPRLEIDPEASPRSGQAPKSQSVTDAVLSALKKICVAEDIAQALVNDAVAKDPSGDPLLLLENVLTTLRSSPPKVSRPKVKAVSRKVEDPDDDDLRTIVKGGAERGKCAYDALKEAGVVRPPLLDFAG